MARKKSNNFLSVFKVFFNSIKTYFMYLDQTSKALAFPIFGQLLSVIVMLTITYFVCTNVDDIKNAVPFFSSGNTLLITLYVILLPFLIVFLKAFYEFIILFASLNLVFYSYSNKKKIKDIDFDSFNSSIKRRFFKYLLLMIVSIPFLVIAPFLAFVFQIFAIENDTSAFGSIKRSLGMVKLNFVSTIIMLLLCYFTTYEFLPNLFIWASQKISVYYSMVNVCEKFLNLFPIESFTSQIDLGMLNDFINEIFSPLAIAKNMTAGIIMFLIVGFTLPLRCCCFTELYRINDEKNIKENSKMTDEIVKRATSKK